jgi:thiol-disulfide isomerase/thioredoxin/uncharacterized membrane protein
MNPVSALRAVSTAVLTILLLTGIGIAGYLVRHHESQVYGDASVVLANCPQNETVNCEVVNTSAWSELFHVPIAAYAIPTYSTVLALLWAGRRRQRLLAYAFGIGLLTTLYSVFLLWVSSTRIGFVCLWCLRLYGINIAIPLLVGIAAWRAPRGMIAEAFADLRRPTRTLGAAAATFVLLSAATIGVQQAYRAEQRREAAAARALIEQQGGPLVPAVPESSPGDGSAAWPPAAGAGESSGLLTSRLALAAITPPVSPAARASAPPPALAPYRVAGVLRRITASKREVQGAPFDLQGRLGKGKPVGLIFWAPGFHASERALVDLARAVAAAAPQIELYAVAGRRDDQRDEEIFEDFATLGVPAGLPLLVDDGFALTNELAATDLFDLALFSAKGALVVSKMQALDQWLVGSQGNVLASDLLRRVAAGDEVPQIKQMHPAYPSAELIGRRAPAFSLHKLGTQDLFTFPGRTAVAKPTLIMFWSATCTHCQVEVPHLVQWVKTHPGAVDVIGVTLLKRDKPGQPSFRTITQSYIEQKGIPWVVLEDTDGAVNDLYESVSTPTTFFVAPSGRVTAIWYYAHEGKFDEAMEAELRKIRQAPPDAPAPPVPAEPRLAMSMTGADGKRVTLASLLDRPAIVHLWATWCKPCVEELPRLLAARSELEKDSGARLVLVSVEDAAAGPRIARFIAKLGTKLTSYRAPTGGVFDLVDPSYRVPRTYLVGKRGRVLASLSGSQDWADPAFRERVRSRIVNDGD